MENSIQPSFLNTRSPSGVLRRSISQETQIARTAPVKRSAVPARNCLVGKRAAVVVYSYYTVDPRPRRASEALARHGMEVDVICLSRESQLPFHEKILGVNVFRVPMRRRREGKVQYAVQYASFFLAAFSFLSLRHLKKPYDLVHVHNMPDFLIFSGLVPRLSGAKLMLDLHDPMPELFRSIYGLSSEALPVRLLKRVEKFSISFADRVLTPNLAFAQLFASRSCAVDKIEIIMNSPEEALFGADQETVALPVGRREGFDLMYHGLLAERQGVDLAVEAVHRLRNRIPGLKLHLYGEPTPYKSHVMQLVKHLKLEDQVQYHGFKLPREIPRLISTADLGLVPNRLNPFTEVNMPTRIFEYLARNRMAVVPRTRGILDYFKEDELIFFEPGNPEDLARKIEWACSNPAHVQRMLARGRETYWQHRWETEEQRFIEVARNLLRA